MIRHWRRSANGEYFAGENHVAFLPTRYRRYSRVGLVYAHGAMATEAQVLDRTTYANLAAIFDVLAGCGFPIIAPYLAGDSWANDAGIMRYDKAREFLYALGAKPGPILGLGGSMGNAVVLAWARQNRELMAAAAGLLGVSDTQDIVTNNRGGLAANVNAAFSGGYSDATYGDEHNPAVFADPDLDGLAYKVWRATDDTIVIPSTVAALVTAIGPTASMVDVTGGHTDTALGNIDATQLADFLLAHQ